MVIYPANVRDSFAKKIKSILTLRRSRRVTPTAVQTKRIESRATRVRLSKSSVFIEQSTSTEPRYFNKKKKFGG
jgi:hypothetical protein